MSNRRDAEFKPNSEDEDSMDQIIDNLENSIMEEGNKKANKVEKRKRMPSPKEKLNIKDYESTEAEEVKKPKKKAKVDSDPRTLSQQLQRKQQRKRWQRYGIVLNVLL
jgi:tRNA G37 N-methylase Trm5